MEHINGFKAAVAAVVGCLTALWGWFGWLVVAWVVCMLLDYGTGTAAALRAGEWSSKVARDGLWHKLGAVVAVLVACHPGRGDRPDPRQHPGPGAALPV